MDGRGIGIGDSGSGSGVGTCQLAIQFGVLFADQNANLRPPAFCLRSLEYKSCHRKVS